MWINEWVNQSGTKLHFKEFKKSTERRIELSLETLQEVSVVKDPSLKNHRCILVVGSDLTITIAPVKDTDGATTISPLISDD